MKSLNMSPAEEEIMNILWSEGSKSTHELLLHFNDEKNWKRQTINTLLSRLIAKGIVKKEGRRFVQNYDRCKYEQLKAQSILEVMYGGSLSNFIAAVAGGEKLSDKEAAELYQWIGEAD